jgi:hypothetical protein
MQRYPANFARKIVSVAHEINKVVRKIISVDTHTDKSNSNFWSTSLFLIAKSGILFLTAYAAEVFLACRRYNFTRTL